ncbi:MAG: hypothetical protein MJE68_03680 [Proteobacteria bacterium]|nr:hypothetical protein [Pseudomonadota bacterium]
MAEKLNATFEMGKVSDYYYFNPLPNLFGRGLNPYSKKKIEIEKYM